MVINYESAKVRFKDIDKTAEERINLYINNDPDGESAFNDFLNGQTEGGSLYEMNFLLNQINNAKEELNNLVMDTMKNTYNDLNTEEGKEKLNNLLSHDELMRKFSKFSKDLQVSQPLMNTEKSKNMRNKVKLGVYISGILGLCFFIALKLLNYGKNIELNKMYDNTDDSDEFTKKSNNIGDDSTLLFKNLITNNK